jgi:molybdopterin converting factor small subunit
MPITVRTGTALRNLLGERQELPAEGGTVGEILKHLGIVERLCDDTGKVRRHFNIHVNDGEEIRLLQDLDTPVNDGDTVTILSAIAGGVSIFGQDDIFFPEKL